ncbi:hypothetical protein ACNKHK_26370 [Shigella flexneri]
MTDNDVVVLDRNCHKSIEQGLILTGAKPVYMVPSRNRYGIIGPSTRRKCSLKAYRKNQRKPADQRQSWAKTVLQRCDQLYLRRCLLQRPRGTGSARTNQQSHPLR